MFCNNIINTLLVFLNSCQPSPPNPTPNTHQLIALVLSLMMGWLFYCVALSKRPGCPSGCWRACIDKLLSVFVCMYMCMLDVFNCHVSERIFRLHVGVWVCVCVRAKQVTVWILWSWLILITSPSSEFLGMGHLALTGTVEWWCLCVCTCTHTQYSAPTLMGVRPYSVVREGAAITAVLIRSTGLLYRSMVGRRGN